MKEFISWNLIDECVTEIAFHLKDTGKDFKGVDNGEVKNSETTCIVGDRIF